MAITTTQQITGYYNRYTTVEVTFTKDVIRALHLLPKQIALKCLGSQWPCVIYSSSMSQAKVIANLNSAFHETAKQAKNMVSLRFSYAVSDKADPISFFVTAKITGIKPYSKENDNLSFIALSFTQQPPDDLILMLGELLEVGRTFQKRKEERIIVNTDAMRKMGIKSKDVTAHVQGVPRKCILRDVSFSGAKILMLGVAKFLQDKPVSIRIFCRDPEETIQLEGKVVRTELVEGRKDIAAVAISFPEDKIPANYKLRVHNYLKNIKHKEPPPSEN